MNGLSMLQYQQSESVSSTGAIYRDVDNSWEARDPVTVQRLIKAHTEENGHFPIDLCDLKKCGATCFLPITPDLTPVKVQASLSGLSFGQLHGYAWIPSEQL